MNILVIGNGFDLAHGLPTKYGDFLEFCKRTDGIYSSANNRGFKSYVKENLKEWKINSEIKQIFEEAYKSRQTSASKKIANGLNVHTKVEHLDELYTCIKDNFWIEYFMKCNMNNKENWIDFESEISEVIQSLNEDMRILGEESFRLENNIQKISNFLLNAKYYGRQKTYKDERDDLLNDLNRLIRAFEIYLDGFVRKVGIERKSPDIEKLEIDFVLSFNYTETFSKLYKISDKARKLNLAPFEYIHGKADIINSIDNDNMVLGIDEYLPEERKDRDVDFIAFKKYYQRIYKGTGSEYKDWVYKIKESRKSIEAKLKTEFPTQIPFFNFVNDARHNLYIFGHSLDVTDRDIFRDLILNDNIYTIIFYFSKEDLGTKIANLVKVIGQDELIRRTGGSTKTIEFKLQQDMVEKA